MSGAYDNYYSQQNYNQYPQQGYYDYNQSYNQSSYPSQGYAENKDYDQSSHSTSNQSYYNQQHSINTGPNTAEGDRGLLGALGGGVAGGFAGKKAGHGFLGTIGGAIVGSLAEDYAKKGRKQKKHHNGRRDGSSMSGQSAAGLSGMASSFFNQKR